MKERLQKILSASGVASRRGAELLIIAGRVTCNGIVCQLGDSADLDVDTICLDGKPIPTKGKNMYIMLNKPKGYVTTLSDEKGRKNVAQLVCDCGQRVYPVGRLDMDSEGLLLLTNDGEFANLLMHPSHQIDKVYSVFVKGFSERGFVQLCKPIVLDGYKISPPKIEKIGSDGEITQLQITIHEGRNRQVRRMCANAGMQVKRLIRVREGALALGDLPAGKWRYLTNDEIESFRI